MHVPHSGAWTGERILFMLGVQEIIHYMYPPSKTETLQIRLQNEMTVFSEQITTISIEFGNLLLLWQVNLLHRDMSIPKWRIFETFT
jgi:hypothetical protein